MPEYTIRPPKIDDAPAVAQLMAACDEALTGESSYADALDGIRNDWSSPDFDRTTDAWVAVDRDAMIVGYESIFELEHDTAWCDGYVHPTRLDQGIGSVLLGRAITRATAATTCQRLRASIYRVEEHGHALFRAAGFKIVRHHWQMRITFDQPPPPPQWPEGISVRRFKPGDERIVYEAIEEAFADHWGHIKQPFDVWQHLKIEHDSFDPALWLLAFDGDQLVGTALCYDRDDKGWIQNLGVLSGWRKRGLGMALLRYAFEVFYERSQHTVGLGVDAASLTGATRLYERAGMRIVHQYDTYELALARSLV